MARVQRCESFAAEDVTKVTAAIRASDFHPSTISVDRFRNCSINRLVKCRPTAMCVELRHTFIQWGIASTANKCTGLGEMLEFAGERTFSSLVHEDALFLLR